MLRDLVVSRVAGAGTHSYRNGGVSRSDVKAKARLEVALLDVPPT